MFSWIKNHKFIFIFFMISFFLLILGFVFSYFKFKNYDEQIILNFSSPFGITNLGYFKDLILFFITFLIIFIINFFLSKILDDRDLLFGKFLALLNFFMALLIFIYFMVIININ